MSDRRALGATSLSLSLLACILLVTGPGSTAAAAEPGTSTSVRTIDTQRVRLVALPQIVQHGRRVARPNAAKAALTATFKPVAVGRWVRLQVRQGPSWQTVTTVRQDAHGRAEVAARASKNGQALTYRMVGSGYKDLPAIKSPPVSTARWLTPTWTDEFAGKSLSPAWTHRGQTYQPASLRRCSRGSAKAVRVGGGAVRLSVMRDPARATKCPARKDGEIAGRYAYRLNGHIGTDQTFSFRYGVAAARIKYPRLRGQHGSFWMQPIGGMYPGGTGHEIDVTEFFGGTPKRSGLFSYIHRYERGNIVKTGANISDRFLRGPRDGWGRTSMCSPCSGRHAS